MPWRNIVLEINKKNCKAIVTIFGSEYAKHPTASDVARLCEQNTVRDFSRTLGNIDFMH